MNRSMPSLPVHHQLLEFTETHVHRVSDAIQPSYPVLSPSPPAPNPSQHQSFPMSQLFAWGGQSTRVSALASFLPKKSRVCVCVCVQLCPTLWSPWTVAFQAPLSMEFSMQYWSALPFPSPGDLPDQGIRPASPVYPAWAGGFFSSGATEE